MNKLISMIIIIIFSINIFGVQGVVLEESSDKLCAKEINDLLICSRINFLMKILKFPSFSTCVIKGNEITWSEGFGYYDLENKKQATENTIYNIASITKTITGTALMQLWEQGLFNLDQDVNNYLPFSLRNPYFPDESITFRMLLSHSSSLNFESGIDAGNYYCYNSSSDPPFDDYPYPWLEEHLIPSGKWYYKGRWSNIYHPGEINIYANVHFDIIAYLVELISGEPFIEYCNTHIFNPLKMDNTSFNISELDIENVAIPYHYHNGEYIQINELSYLFGTDTPSDKYWRVHFYPAGGLYTTVNDLSHFLIAHMNGGFYKGIRILNSDTVEEMHRIQPPETIFYMEKYGLAWQIMEDPLNPLPFNVTLSGHGGGLIGVNAWMFYMPSENIGVIYFNNGDKNYEQNMAISVISSLLISLLIYNIGYYKLIR